MSGDPNNLFGGQSPEELRPALPEDQSPLLGDAIGLHVMFTNLIEAGFTERQACWLLGAMVGSKS